MRARGTPDAQRIRSLVRKGEFLAHEQSHHESAGHIRRSARNGWNGLLCMTPGVRCWHHRKSKTRATAPGSCNLGRLRYGVVVSLAKQKRRSLLRDAPHSISPRIEHRTRPPHPTPRIVTIAKRPSEWRRDGAKINAPERAGIVIKLTKCCGLFLLRRHHRRARIRLSRTRRFQQRGKSDPDRNRSDGETSENQERRRKAHCLREPAADGRT